MSIINYVSEKYKDNKEYMYNYLNSHKYCEVRDDLQEYYNQLESLKESINSQVNEFSTVSDENASFYGQVCRNYMNRSNEMYDKLVDLVAELEKQCQVIKDNIDKANNVAQNYINTYKSMEKDD